MNFVKWFLVYLVIILGMRVLYIDSEVAEFFSNNLQPTVKFVYEAF